MLLSHVRVLHHPLGTEHAAHREVALRNTVQRLPRDLVDRDRETGRLHCVLRLVVRRVGALAFGAWCQFVSGSQPTRWLLVGSIVLVLLVILVTGLVTVLVLVLVLVFRVVRVARVVRVRVALVAVTLDAHLRAQVRDA